MDRMLLPFLKKGKKYRPSSREKMGLIDGKLFTAEPAWIRAVIFFSALGGIEFSTFHPAVAAWQMLWRGKQGREKLKTKSLRSCSSCQKE